MFPKPGNIAAWPMSSGHIPGAAVGYPRATGRIPAVPAHCPAGWEAASSLTAPEMSLHLLRRNEEPLETQKTRYPGGKLSSLCADRFR